MNFKNWLLIITITLLTTLTWHKLLNQAFLGEGYYYFDRQQDFINQGGKLAETYHPDLFARALFDILPPIFGDQIFLYLAFQLFVMILLNITIFYFVKFFTKNNLIAFVATVIFLSSYMANFEMLGVGQYQRFAQRIPILIPLLLSFIQLAKYLETKKLIFYFLSISLFAVSVFFGHFATFLLPLFFIYPIIYQLFEKITIRNFLTAFSISFSFVFINYLIILQDHLKPNTSFGDFLISKGILPLIEDIILQLGNMVIPPFIIEKVASISNPYTLTLIILTIPIIALFVLGIKFIDKKDTRLKLIYLSSLVFIPSLLFLNLYLGKVNPGFNISGYHYYFTPPFYIDQLHASTVKGDRYYLVPYIFISILFSFLLWLIWKKGLIGKIIILPILLFYFTYNLKLIWNNLDAIQPISNVMKNYIQFTKSNSSKFDNNTIIIAPRDLIWPSSFIRAFYGKPEMQFYLINDNWKSLTENKKVLIFDYDYKKNKVIDLSDQKL